MNVARIFSKGWYLLPKLQSQQPFMKNISVALNHNSKKKGNEIINLMPVELATGMCTNDIVDTIGGDCDPYSVKTLIPGPGTKEQPNMIPSAFESRMVGCICEEDSATITWMWLQKGEPKRCLCGFWFQLYYQAPFPEKLSLVD